MGHVAALLRDRQIPGRRGYQRQPPAERVGACAANGHFQVRAAIEHPARRFDQIVPQFGDGFTTTTIDLDTGLNELGPHTV